ncbi:MAG: hypothetical protein ACE5G0_14990, partial [Rhodothermales bacterium]
MAHVKRKPPRLVERKGYWNLVFYNTETRKRRWHALGTTSKTTAQRRARLMERAWEDGQFDPFREPFEFEAYTVKRAVAYYRKSKEGVLKPKSLRTMLDVLNLLVQATPAIAIQHVEAKHVKKVVGR